MDTAVKDSTSPIQTLPLEILLLILDHLDYRHIVSLSQLCSSLKNALDAYLLYHPSVDLSNGDSIDEPGTQSIADFIEVIAKFKPVALSIRQIDVSRLSSYRLPRHALSDEICNRISRAVAIRSDRRQPWRDADLDVDGRAWLLTIFLMCRNLESISILTDLELGWHRTSQILKYTQWPNKALKHFSIRWTTNPDSGAAYRAHDLQDLWLLYSAPSLETMSLEAMQQGNNLYTGGADRAAIRTTYWPNELEIPSLYHHAYLGQMVRGREPPRDRPKSIPSISSRLPIDHGFPYLHRLSLRKLKVPETWLLSLLPCFANLKHLELSLSANIFVENRLRHLFDLRLLSTALDKLSGTLESLVLDVQTPRRQLNWINAARCGFVSVGCLPNMQELRIVTLPWFAWLPHERLVADPHGTLGPCEIDLPPRLERLSLSRCELASPGVMVELVNATLKSRISNSPSNESLKTIVLQADIELALKQADFVQLAENSDPDCVEIVLEKVLIAHDGLIVNN